MYRRAMPVLALALLSTLAVAVPLEEDPAYSEGMRLFEDFEYEKAVFRFKDALRVEDRSPAEKATVLIRLGMTYAELRDEASARESFLEALQADPLAVLPADASPKIKTLLDEARAELRQARAAGAAPAGSGAGTPAASPGASPGPSPGGAPSTAAAPDEAPPADALPDDAPKVDEGGMPWILIGGAAVAGVGLLVGLVGGAAWGAGAGLALYANGLEYQDEAAPFALPSQIAQYAGQAALAVGVLVIVAGGAVAGASFLLE